MGMAIAELAVALTVIGTALFGSPELSERAFRLLRWNRPARTASPPLSVLRTTKMPAAAKQRPRKAAQAAEPRARARA